jgi:hypothetical protein
MNVTFRCPQCDQTVRADHAPHQTEIVCPACKAKWRIADQAIEGGEVKQCFICPSTELFIRKDFSQSLGVIIVVIGIVVSSVFWAYHMPIWTYAVLFTTALIDVVLYLTVGSVLQCYRCQAQYRDVPGLEKYGGFDLETHEKHRQQRIRLAQQTKASA